MNNFYNLKEMLFKILNPNGKFSFLSQFKDQVRILDCGCGNNSPYKIKKYLAKAHYTGIDIQNYNQTKPLLADHYVLTTGDKYSADIKNFGEVFDVVLSSHNIEHCDNYEETVESMALCLKPGGQIYISFPSHSSQFNPNRNGTLNYYDDKSHSHKIPDINKIASILENKGIKIVKRVDNNAPPLLWIIGAIQEPLSFFNKKVYIGTWAFYGFESILWGKKISK